MSDDQNNFDNPTPDSPESPDSSGDTSDWGPTENEPQLSQHLSMKESFKEKAGSLLAKFKFGRKKQQEENPSDVTSEFAGESPTRLLHEPETELPTGTRNTLAAFPTEQEEPTAEIAMSGVPAPRVDSSGSGLNYRRMELLNVAEWFSQSLQNRGYAFYGKLFTLIVCCYFLADVVALFVGRYIPEPSAIRNTRPINIAHRVKTIEDYNPIIARNLFNRKGLIPGEETPSGPVDMGGAPVRTSLPFNLVGTLILRDEMRSIATIEDKSASMVYPVRIEEEIPTKARILKIEPRRVIFVNTQSGRREFVELPEEQISNARISIGGGSTTKSPGIEQVSNNQFNIARAEVDKALGDFNNILTQARAVPNIENGVPTGYKLFQIVPGSIFDKLGLKNGDAILGVDGQPINDPAKAFELLGKLKEGAGHMELAIKKPDGKTSTMVYDIR